MSYSKLGSDKRKPRADRDGIENVGKPCVVCGKFTLGIKWLEVDYMRGNDIEVRVCNDHWTRHTKEIINAVYGTKECSND